MNEPNGKGSVHSPFPVLVGVCHHQHPEVVATAARFAASLGLDVVCAYAITGLESSEWKVKGSIDFEMLDLDEREEIGSEAIRELQNTLGAALSRSPVRWSLRILVGDPVRALEEFATALDASMLVLGSPRKRHFGFTGSRIRTSTLARLLTHRTVPVLVVPPASTPAKPKTSYLP